MPAASTTAYFSGNTRGTAVMSDQMGMGKGLSEEGRGARY